MSDKLFDSFQGDVVFLFMVIFTSLLMISHVPYIAVNKAPKKASVRNISIVLIVIALLLSIKYFTYVYISGIWIYIIFGFYKMTMQIINVKNKQNKHNEVGRFK